MTPRASCIVAVHNDERRLRRSLASLIAQTVRDIEIIVVDDGSTDGSGALADSLAALDPRIRVLHLERGGAAAARNRGAEAASGEWLVIQDADDYARPDRIERLLAFAAEHPSAGVVASAGERVGPDGRRLGRVLLGPTSIEEFRRARAGGRLVYVINGAAMVRRKLFLAAGGYPEDYTVAEDLALVNLRLASLTDVVVEPDAHVYIEVHADSLSRRHARGIVEADDVVRLNLGRLRAGLPALGYEDSLRVLAAQPWLARLHRRRRQLWHALFARGSAEIAGGSVLGAARIALAAPLAPLRTAQVLWPRLFALTIRGRRLAAARNGPLG